MSLRARLLEEQEKEFSGSRGGLGFMLVEHTRKGVDVHQKKFGESPYLPGFRFGEWVGIMRSVVPVFPNGFSPCCKIGRDLFCTLQLLKSNSHFGIWFGPQMLGCHIYNLSAHRPAGIPIFVDFVIQGFLIKNLNIIRKKWRNIGLGNSWVNLAYLKSRGLSQIAVSFRGTCVPQKRVESGEDSTLTFHALKSHCPEISFSNRNHPLCLKFGRNLMSAMWTFCSEDYAHG